MSSLGGIAVDGITITGEQEATLKHPDGAPIDNQRPLPVQHSDGTRQAEVTANKEIKTHDADLLLKLDQTKTTLQTEFDQTQVKQDLTNTKIDELKTLEQIEHDQTQALISSELGTTRTLLQTEFDQSQSKQDTTNTKIDELKALEQVEHDQTQVILQTEFDQTQVKQDLTNTKIDELKTITQTENDQTQTLLQTEFDQTQTAIATTNTKIDELKALEQVEHDQTQVKIDTTNTKIDELKALTQAEHDQTQVKIDLTNTKLDELKTLEQTEHDQTQVGIGLTNTKLDELKTITQTENDQTQVKLDDLKTEVDASNYTMNEAFNKSQAIGGQMDDTSTVDATEGNVAPVRITPKRALHSNLRDNAGNELLGRKTAVFSIPTVQAEDLTYSAAASAFVPASAATDIFTIIGSATKVIRVHKIRVTMSTTSGTGVKTTFQLIKRSTVNTAGTRVAGTPVPHDSTSAAATANVGHYTANPTGLGTLVGIIRSHHGAVTNVGISGGDVTWEFPDEQPLTLRGATENLAINLNGVTIAGPICSISVEWTEV